MSKVLECIYAYLYRNNYMGRCGGGDNVYTLTEGLELAEMDALDSVMRYKGTVELEKIDMDRGVVRHSASRPKVDDQIVSFSYYPAASKRHSAVCRHSYRQSLHGLSVRGHKELVHALLFEEIPAGDYAVDYTDSPILEEHGEIPLDGSAQVAGDAVCEVRPEKLKPHTIEDFAYLSHPLSLSDIRALPGPPLLTLAETVHAILTAKRSGRPMCFLYDPADWAVAREFLRAALKLFPAKLSNKLSLVTCYGSEKGPAVVDVCGIPTCDDEYISSLKQMSCAVQLSPGGTGVTGIGGEKGPFAAFLASATDFEFETWLSKTEAYFASVESFEGMDEAALLFMN